MTTTLKFNVSDFTYLCGEIIINAMNKFLSFILIVASFVVNAQNNINLVLNHQFDGSPFVYNDVYADDQGRAVSFERVQYYMSSIAVVHDGAQSTDLTDVYVLGAANVSNYFLGNYTVNNIEQLNFNLGVDYASNHGNSSNYAAPHPLSPQAPLMDWGWPSGYFFLVIDGKVDNTGDGIPNKMFSMRCLGDVMLRGIDIAATAVAYAGNIDLALDVNIEKWIKNIDLVAVGIDHSSSSNNQNVATNTNTFSVFENSASTGVNDVKVNAYIATDYAMAYAPILNYKLEARTNNSLTILDAQGRVVVEEKDLGFEGSYFVKQELNSGMYYAVFSNPTKTLTHKFVVKR